MLAIGDKCRVLKDDKWVAAKVLRVHNKTARLNVPTPRPRVNGQGEIITVPFNSIWKCKKPAMRKDSFGGGKADCVLSTKRKSRHRKLVEVVPTFFNPTQVIGDFGRMLRDADIRETSVCCFNDNHGQWIYAGLNPTVPQNAGGGNAIARPYEYLGDAIGIPTGPYATLTQMKPVQFPGEDMMSERSAKEIIDEAFNRVVRKQLANPDKTTFYYSADSNDPDGKRLGMGIFAGSVGDCVISYITDKFVDLPRTIQKARVTGTIP